MATILTRHHRRHNRRYCTTYNYKGNTKLNVETLRQAIERCDRDPGCAAIAQYDDSTSDYYEPVLLELARSPRALLLINSRLSDSTGAGTPTIRRHSICKGITEARRRWCTRSQSWRIRTVSTTAKAAAASAAPPPYLPRVRDAPILFECVERSLLTDADGPLFANCLHQHKDTMLQHGTRPPRAWRRPSRRATGTGSAAASQV